MAADFPLDITDGRNIRVRINQPPQRVVCLVPAITETIVRLGQEDVLVGDDAGSISSLNHSCA